MLIRAAQNIDILIKEVIFITIDGDGNGGKVERVVYKAFVVYRVGSQKEERDVSISSSQSRDWIPRINTGRTEQ